MKVEGVSSVQYSTRHLCVQQLNLWFVRIWWLLACLLAFIHSFIHLTQSKSSLRHRIIEPRNGNTHCCISYCIQLPFDSQSKSDHCGCTRHRTDLLNPPLHDKIIRSYDVSVDKVGMPARQEVLAVQRNEWLSFAQEGGRGYELTTTIRIFYTHLRLLKWKADRKNPSINEIKCTKYCT